MKKKISLSICFIMIISMFAFTSSVLATQELVMGGIQSPTAPPTLAGRFFGEEIERRTEGRYTVRMVEGAALGPILDQYEQTMTGAQDFIIEALGFNSNFVKDYGVMAVPFAIQNKEELKTFLESDIADGWRKQLQEEYNLMTLTDKLIRSPRVVHSTRRVETAEDMEGMPFRVPEIETYFEGWRAIGVNPTPVAWGEVYMALNQGVIDAGEGPFTTHYPMGFTEASKYVLETNHLYATNTIIMNNDLFESLSEEDKKHFIEAAEATEVFFENHILAMEMEHRELIESEHGAEFIQPTDEAIAEFASRVEEKIEEWEEMGLWSEGLYDEMINTIR